MFSSVFSFVHACGFRQGRSSDNPLIAFVGLDSAGKSSLLIRMDINDGINVIGLSITGGFYLETLNIRQLKLESWDAGGSGNFRLLNRMQLERAKIMVFVIDSSERERTHDVRKELLTFLSHEMFGNKPVLFLANKQDLLNAMSLQEVIERCEINKIRDRTWYIIGTSAVTGSGISDMLEWIEKTLKTDECGGSGR